VSLDKRATLARHGLAYRFNGIPTYDTDTWSGEQVITGVVYEPTWKEADLKPRHWNELAEWFAEDRAAFDERPDRAAYWTDARLLYALMDRNGVEHEHLHGEPLIERRPAYGYKCAMCGDAIIAKDPGDSPFYGGPLSGRWMVTYGQQVVRVSVPSSLSVATEDALADLSTPVVEYRRGRDGGYYIDRRTLP